MTTAEFRATLKELMYKFDYYRLAWLENYGTEEGFNAWFSQQVKELS